MSDPYLWPGINCLRNKLGITDPEKLAEVEHRIAYARDVELIREIVPGEYNLQHFQRFHWGLFQDIYDWAGQSRTVNIAKDGLLFGSWQYLDDEVSAVLERLATDRWLIGLNRHSFLDKLAFYYGELNARHLFREGNGRAQRAFLRQLSAAAGLATGLVRVERGRQHRRVPAKSAYGQPRSTGRGPQPRDHTALTGPWSSASCLPRNPRSSWPF